MCGIFGFIAKEKVNQEGLMTLALHARQRGRDSSGLIYADASGFQVKRADYDIKKLISQVKPFDSAFVLGHSRLITNGLADNQPVVRGDVCVIHNGIIVNDAEVWNHIKPARALEIDSEVIAAIAEQHLEENGDDLDGLSKRVLELCVGVIACAIVIPRLGKALIFSNNGSLYLGSVQEGICFSSEMYPLTQIGCSDIQQVRHDAVVLDLPVAKNIKVTDNNQRVHNLIPPFQFISSEEKQLLYPQPNLRRCTRCILPETMPFIEFDAEGVCNYCHAYTPRNVPKPKEELFNLVEGYRRAGVTDCIVPFSGGRDSCYGLHLVVKELKMNAVTYTYDWGMVTDLGRRNISRMSAELGVENIIVADDIAKKRRNIAVNLKAWLKAPHLGMISILTAGDKHFFRHIETVKRQTGVSLNLWGSTLSRLRTSRQVSLAYHRISKRNVCTCTAGRSRWSTRSFVSRRCCRAQGISTARYGTPCPVSTTAVSPRRRTITIFSTTGGGTRRPSMTRLSMTMVGSLQSIPAPPGVSVMVPRGCTTISTI